ncbi:MAG: hypothetical protein KDA61_15195, partial [Planctomycetales bacterium]|nr:hypothetical protein [Planctomycetales bacterium]
MHHRRNYAKFFRAAACTAAITLACVASRAPATTITFEGAASGNNADIPLEYGSYVSGNATGFTTTDGTGATPHVGLAWLGDLIDEWEYHTATTWVHESPVAVAQIDHNRGGPYDPYADVVFTPRDGRSVVINSFLLTGATDMNAEANFAWEVVGAGVSGVEVVGVGENTGVINVGFTGQPGVPYTLRFTRLPGFDSGFGTALDDLSFSETLLPNAEVLNVRVDRLTGEASLVNVGGTAATIRGYSLASSSGALDPSQWTSIRNHYDVNGNKTFDPNDAWTVLPGAGSDGELSEFQFGGDGGTLNSAGELSLGRIWRQSPFEDLALEIVLADGRIAEYSVVFEGGPAGGFAVGDLNYDGAINALDWPIYNAGRGVDLSTLSVAAAYQMGDLDGDLDNDIRDFLMFKANFVALNGEAAFASLGAVPEPGSVGLALIGFATTFRRRLRRSRAATPRLPKAVLNRQLVWLVAAACSSCLFATFAQATTLTFATDPLPANNADVPEFFGSNIAAESAGFVTSDGSGATPNIGLTWFPAGSTGAEVWEFHSAATFQGFGFDVPVAQLDVDGSVQPGGVPPADPTIDFVVGPSTALELFGFKIGNATDQSEPAYGWTINLIRISDMATVATRTTGLMGPGDLVNIDFNYIGEIGESYRLLFDDAGANRVRSAIDDLKFGEASDLPQALKLTVNTTTGELTLSNPTPTGIAFDTY